MVFVSCNYKLPDPNPDLWIDSGIKSNTNIRNMYSTATQLMVVSDDEFLRIGPDNELIERRSISLPVQFLGFRPTMSEFVFVRVIELTGTKKLEFHVVKNPNQVVQYELQQLEDLFDLALDPETDAYYTGAFNEDGSQFLYPMQNSTDENYCSFPF